MLIKIFEENELIFLEVDGNRKEFDFSTLDSLIDVFLEKKDELEIDCNEELKNYKTLIEEIYKEVNTEDFMKAVEEANKYKTADSLKIDI